MRIGDDELLHLERLTRLRLTPEERATVASDLERVLAHLGEIASVDVTGLEPMLRPVHVEDGTRGDVRRPGLPREDVSRLARAERDGFLLVPRTGGDD